MSAICSCLTATLQSGSVKAAFSLYSTPCAACLPDPTMTADAAGSTELSSTGRSAVLAVLAAALACFPLPAGLTAAEVSSCPAVNFAFLLLGFCSRLSGRDCRLFGSAVFSAALSQAEGAKQIVQRSVGRLRAQQTYCHVLLQILRGVVPGFVALACKQSASVIALAAVLQQDQHHLWALCIRTDLLFRPTLSSCRHRPRRSCRSSTSHAATLVVLCMRTICFRTFGLNLRDAHTQSGML